MPRRRSLRHWCLGIPMWLLSLTRDVEVWKRREHSHVRAARLRIHWLNSASVGEMRHPWLSGDGVAKAAAWTEFAANGLAPGTWQMQSNLAVSIAGKSSRIAFGAARACRALSAGWPSDSLRRQVTAKASRHAGELGTRASNRTARCEFTCQRERRAICRRTVDREDEVLAYRRDGDWRSASPLILDTGSLRVTSSTAGFDAVAAVVTTSSGRKYELDGPPESRHAQLALLAANAQRVGLGDAADVSDSVWMAVTRQ